MKKKYKRPLLLGLAIIFLFESWLWDASGRAVRWVIRVLPIEHLTQKIRTKLDLLSPTQTLGVFIVPVLVLLPLKFVALYMLSQGLILRGVTAIIFAKLVGFGISSFLFALCKPKLLQVRWVKWMYEHCIVWRDKAHELVKPYTRFIKRYLAIAKPRQNVIGKLRAQVHKMRQ